MSDSAEPFLRQQLAQPKQLTLEQRRRIEAVLARLKGSPSAEHLRISRATKVLEEIGTAEARKLLHELAQGAAGARLTREAQAAVRRLRRDKMTR